MKIKAIYRNNLKMTEGKVAAQVAHAVIGLGITDPLCTIVVLKVGDAKFAELVQQHECYVHADSGFTEVNPGERTAAAWIEYVTENCRHEFVDARNETVKSGEVCLKCGSIRPGNHD